MPFDETKQFTDHKDDLSHGQKVREMDRAFVIRTEIYSLGRKVK